MLKTHGHSLHREKLFLAIEEQPFKVPKWTQTFYLHIKPAVNEKSRKIHCKEITEKLSPLKPKILRLKQVKTKPFHFLYKPDLLG